MMTASQRDPERSPPVVAFHGVGRIYPGPPPFEALRPIDLTVDRGDYVTVVGPSGSGKSTFLNVAGLLDRPTSGRYEMEGIDVGDLSEAHRTALRGRRIGFVFQAYHLAAHRPAIDNVMLGLLYHGTSQRERRLRSIQALERVSLEHRVWALPSRMSGGERQRVAIARAIVTQPSLLLCDEPTGNLDSGTSATVLDLFQELHGAGMTLVVITHDPSVAERGQRRILIRDGELSEEPPRTAAATPVSGHAP